MEVVKEKSIYSGRLIKASNPDTAKNAKKGKYGATAIGFTQHDTRVQDTRNRRSVWTVTSKPYKGAHFAVFPPDLIEPCILAGCPENGTVLDPFAGAGTTGLVAMKHDMRAVLIELNESYCRMMKGRIESGIYETPLFNELETEPAEQLSLLESYEAKDDRRK